MTSFELPVEADARVLAMPYGENKKTTQVPPDSPVYLLITDVPKDTTLKLHRGQEAAHQKFDATDLLSVYVKLISVTTAKSRPNRTCPIEQKKLYPIAELYPSRIRVLRSAGVEPGHRATLSVCKGDECKPGEKPDSVVAKVPIYPGKARFDGPTFLLNGSFGFGSERAYGPPSYRPVGDPVDEQQTYRLDYYSRQSPLSLSLLLAGRLSFGGPLGRTNFVVGTGPVIAPGPKKIPFQWDTVVGYRPLPGLYLTAGLGMRRMDVPRVAQVGEIRVSASNSPPSLDDTELEWFPMALVGLSLDLAAIGEGAVDLVKGVQED